MLITRNLRESETLQENAGEKLHQAKGTPDPAKATQHFAKQRMQIVQEKPDDLRKKR